MIKLEGNILPRKWVLYNIRETSIMFTHIIHNSVDFSCMHGFSIINSLFFYSHIILWRRNKEKTENNRGSYVTFSHRERIKNSGHHRGKDVDVSRRWGVRCVLPCDPLCPGPPVPHTCLPVLRRLRADVRRWTWRRREQLARKKVAATTCISVHLMLTVYLGKKKVILQSSALGLCSSWLSACRP